VPTPQVQVSALAPVDPMVEVSGRVVATLTGEGLGGVSIDMSGVQATTDPTGLFGLVWDLSTRPPFGRTTLTGPGILARGLTIGAVTSRAITIDAIRLDGAFDLDYYRKLVRDTADAPDVVRSLRRWTRPPRIYLKTVDERDRPIDEATLRSTEAALADEAMAWTGGQFGIAEIVRGTGTREGVGGWITVKWPNPAEGNNICGRAQVAVEGGWIELHYLNPSCRCQGSAISPGTVRHEIGHAFGFFHTHEPLDLLSYTRSYETWCDGRPSARERLHAAIAYSRPVGNLDPDIDPASTIQSHPPTPIVIVD
jgi:hypothetical protein